MSQLTIEKQVSIEKKVSTMDLLAPFSDIRKMRARINRRKNFYRSKRILDIIASTIVIIFFLSWFVPLIALFIRLESRGPVFFRQRRVGKDGKTFWCLKFRTMVLNEDANTVQADANDSRITRVGQFLRVSNLDEFPQFINVIRGEMSIVGPRPHMHSDCRKFAAVVGNYQFRHLVKPGITGLAQVKGYRGPTKDFTSIFHRYQFDAFYVRNANFWLDMRIIRKTAIQTITAFCNRLLTVGEYGPISQKRWVVAIRSLLS